MVAPIRHFVFQILTLMFDFVNLLRMIRLLMDHLIVVLYY